jgi:hemerythrin-like domain-containing protein
MNPIEELKTEHRAVEAALSILSEVAAEIEKTDSRAAVADAERLIDFFKTFVDACHHGKEEDFLFPALRRIGVSGDNGPIGVMLNEHDSGRKHIKEMKDALIGARTGNRDAVKVFKRNAIDYIDLLRRHIEKEDHVLFKIAEERLSTDCRAELSESFERLEKEKIGSGRHEAFHEMLEELQKKYAGG